MSNRVSGIIIIDNWLLKKDQRKRKNNNLHVSNHRLSSVKYYQNCGEKRQTNRTKLIKSPSAAA